MSLASPQIERIADIIAKKLEGYSDAVVNLDDLVADAFDEHKLAKSYEMSLLRAIDRRVFLCPGCGHWHEQVYNARPDGEWICKECARDEHDG